MQTQSDDLKARNQALLAKNAQLEEQLWRLSSRQSSPSQPFASDQNVEGRTPARPEACGRALCLRGHLVALAVS